MSLQLQRAAPDGPYTTRGKGQTKVRRFLGRGPLWNWHSSANRVHDSDAKVAMHLASTGCDTATVSPPRPAPDPDA